MNNTGDEFKLESVAEPKKLVLLDDSPAGADGPSSVAFSHEIYADIVRDVLLTNRAGVCVGFFARWGQGKSTVVNLLAHGMGEKAKLVIFNAYQARGDSVRRQMLLSVLRQIDSEKAEHLERFTQTTTALAFATTAERENFSLRKIIQRLFKERKLDVVLVGASLVAVFCIAAAAAHLFWKATGKGPVSTEDDIVAIAWKSLIGSAAVIWTTLIGSVAFIWKKLHERRDQILNSTQPVSDSQCLKYPEQFEKVFSAAVQEYCTKNKKRLVIVVDDLDRCEPATVVEALASVRQFCHRSGGNPLDCQFLVPCDEGQMISALEADGYLITACHTRYHNYSEGEMLRKFFDFVVRMDEIVPESLADFAAEQARKIGVSPELARDVVDAAAIREPRKVKSLLNALRVAQETVARSQRQELLPTSEHLERFDYTLAMLVCFQELAPVAFGIVRENTEVLSQPILPSDKGIESIAHRFFSSFGPVSAATADVLITKQNEPSLRGLPQSHILPAAVRADRGEEVVKILSSANNEHQCRLLAWLGRKLRDARSSVKIKQLMGYVLDFGHINGWRSPALDQFHLILIKQNPFLTEALRLGSRLESFGSYCGILPNNNRRIFDQIILQNYLASPESQPDEEKYVLRFADKLSIEDANKLRTSVIKAITHQSTGLNLNRLKQLFDNLPKEREAGCYGFSPKTGERLLSWLVDTGVENPQAYDYQESGLRVGLCFIGSDSNTANAVLVHLMRDSVNFFKSPEDLSESYLRIKGVGFESLYGLLANQAKLEKFDAFFQSRYQLWLDNQAHSNSRLKILHYIQPGWGFLSENSLSHIGKVIAPWPLSDEDFAKDVVATIDTPTRPEGIWVKGRQFLRKSFFSQFCNHAEGQTELSSAAKLFLTSVQVAGWDVREQAEVLLADKAHSLNPNVGGRPNNILDWFEMLKPLCDPRFLRLSKVVRESLANNSAPQELIKFALKSVWSESIPSDCAVPLADVALRLPGAVLTNDSAGIALAKQTGFEEVARVILAQLPGRGADWMHAHKQFMVLLSDFVVRDGKLAAKFQETIDALLTANSREFFDTGVQLLAKHNQIVSDVKRSLEVWCKAQGEADDLVKIAAEICSRPEL